MKRIVIFLTSCLFSTVAMAGPNAIRLTQRNTTDTASLNRDLDLPAGTANGMMVIDGPTLLPKMATFDGGLSWNGTSLTTSAIPQANVSGLSGTLATYQPINSKLTEYDSMTLGAGEVLQRSAGGVLQGITVSTLGQQMMAAASASAMKAMIFTGSASNVVFADGSDAALTTSSVAEGSNLYYTTARALAATSLAYVAQTTSVNGHALSSNVTVTKADLSLGNVDNTADASKVFSASQITAGTMPDARVAQSNVTQHQAALAIAATQITGSKTSAFISDFAAAVVAAAPVTSVAGKTGVVSIVAADMADFATTARATVLTGLSTVTATAITSADSLLTALGKLQAQVTSLSSSKYDASNPSGYVSTSGARSAISVTGGAASYNSSTGVITITTPPVIQAYEGTTQRVNAFPVFKSGTIATGIATVYFTTDNTSTGTAICPNGVIKDSVQAVVNDASALYPMGWAWSNSDKTLAITTNKATSTGVIALLGINILGAPVAAANGSVIKVTAWCY